MGRTFLLLVNGGSGSCFFLKKGEDTRLYTAAHVMETAMVTKIEIDERLFLIPVGCWIVDPRTDIAYIKSTDLSGEIIENLKNGDEYNFMSISSDNINIEGEFMMRIMEMYGYPQRQVSVFKRVTYIANNSIVNGSIYTDNSSVQGFSGGPLVAPEYVSNGAMTVRYKNYGVCGVISNTFCDNTGGKFGVVSLIIWN